MASPTSNPTNQPNANDPGGVIHNRTAALETGASSDLAVESKRPRTDNPFHSIRVNPSQLRVQTASIANNSDSWTRRRKLELVKLAQGPNDAASFTPFDHDAVIDVVEPVAIPYDMLQDRREGTAFSYVEVSRDGEVVLRTTVSGSSNHKLYQCLYPEYKLTATQIKGRLEQYCDVDGRNFGTKLRGILDVERVDKHIIRSKLGWVGEWEREITSLLAEQLQRQNGNPHFSELLCARKVLAATDDLEVSEVHSKIRECVLAFILFSIYLNIYPNLISSLLITTTSTTMNRI